MKNGNMSLKSTGVLLLLILVVMAGLIYINNSKSGAGKEAFKSVRSLSLEGQVEAAEKNSHICNVDELLLEATGAVVRAKNIKGEAIWERTLVGQVLILKGTASNAYIVDSSKRLYCISKSGKVLWDKQLEGEINELFIDRSGDILVDSRNSQGSKIKIISSKGVDEGEMSIENSAVVAFASGNGENTISIVDVSTQVLKTRLITLNLKGAMIWSDSFDNQIIPMVGYGKANTLIAIGEKTIYKYKGEGKKQDKLELNKTIYNADIAEDGVVAVVRSRRGFDSLTYDLNFKEIGRFEAEDAPKGIILGENNYILYYSEKLLVCDLKGSAKGQYKSIPSINSVQFTSDENIILLSNRLIQKLSYQ